MKKEFTKIALAVLGLAIVLFLSCADNQTLEYPSMDVFFPESSGSETDVSSPSSSEGTGSSSSTGTTSLSSSSLGAGGSSSSSSPGGGSSSESQELGTFDGTYFTDPRDSKKYKCEYAPAAYGGKLWMSENLNYSRGNTLGYCYGVATENANPHMDATSCNNSGYGRLYDTWETAMDGNSKQGLCPKGWHIPNTIEWRAIGAAVSPATSAIRVMSSGFYILSGNYDYAKTTPIWSNLGSIGFYWTSDDKNTFVMMQATNFQVKVDPSVKDNEIFSIRCVADDGMFVRSSSSGGGSGVSSSSGGSSVSSSGGGSGVSSSSILSVSSSSTFCSDFDPYEEVEHYGMNKKQFCDPRDGNKYAYVPITVSTSGGGTKSLTWMADNLNYAADGSSCPDDGCEAYGRLYDWQAATGGANNNASNIVGVCPAGWRLPTENDWTQLTGNSITMKNLLVKEDYNSSCNGEDTYGFSARVISTEMFFLASTGLGWDNNNNSFTGYKRAKLFCSKSNQAQIDNSATLITPSFVRCIK